MSILKHSLPRLFHLLATMTFAAVLVSGCGGGGGGDSGSTATKTSFTSGAITGFGSVIINGIRFDVSSASVADDDDESHDESDLKLGMVAEVEAGEIIVDSTGSHCVATSIRFRSAIVGPVGAVDVNAKTLVVLGQTVDVTEAVFDEDLPAGLADIEVNDVVEVYGMLDRSTGRFTAKRVEPKPNAPFYRLLGVVGNLNTSARTFTIGSETISYAGLAPEKVPANLANDLLVRVKLETTQVDSAWVATKVKAAARYMDDHDEVELKGLVTSVTSQAQFSVDGIPIDASNARFVPDGSTIVVGAEVEVEGRASNGVIIATKVELENEDDDADERFELHGAISTIDPVNKTFELRGVTVDYSGNVTFDDGTINDLAVGAKVEVKGPLSADGTKLAATRIEFEQ